LSDRKRRDTIAEFVEAAHGALEQTDYYRVLGVSSAASSSEIRASYYNLAQSLHPDVHGETLEEAYREKLTAVFSRVVEAYKVLSDEERRSNYDSALAGGAMRLRAGAKHRPRAPEDQIQHAAAKKFFQLGLTALRAKNCKTAVQNFKLALKMEPESELIKKKLAEAEAESKG